jgi:putative transposase
VIGWSIADHLRAELVVDALQMSTWRRQPLWTLYCADQNEKWHRYDRGTAVRYVDPLLDELAEGPSGIFWG